MVSPFWSHKNPKYFPDPHAFNPVRFTLRITYENYLSTILTRLFCSNTSIKISTKIDFCFIKDRWKTSDLEKNIFLDGFIAFGGGRYQCPGRSVRPSVNLSINPSILFVYLTIYVKSAALSYTVNSRFEPVHQVTYQTWCFVGGMLRWSFRCLLPYSCTSTKSRYCRIMCLCL